MVSTGVLGRQPRAGQCLISVTCTSRHPPPNSNTKKLLRFNRAELFIGIRELVRESSSLQLEMTLALKQSLSILPIGLIWLGSSMSTVTKFASFVANYAKKFGRTAVVPGDAMAVLYDPHYTCPIAPRDALIQLPMPHSGQQKACNPHQFDCGVSRWLDSRDARYTPLSPSLQVCPRAGMPAPCACCWDEVKYW